MEIAPTTIFGLIIVLTGLILSHIGQWIREGRKAKTFKKKNDQLGTIETAVKTVDKNIEKLNLKTDEQTKQIGDQTLAVGKLQEKVESQANHCSTTVSAVFKAIESNSNKIFTLAKSGSKTKK